MIVLLEPPRRDGQCSGGYRYQDEIGRRLQATGRGRQLAVAPGALAEAIAAATAPEHSIVLDGLFASLPVAPPTRRCDLLLHMELPAASAGAWLPRCRRVIATAPRTVDTLPCAVPVAMVTPGLDPCFRTPASKAAGGRPVRLICVGAITPHKRQLELLELLATLPTRPAFELTLLGDRVADPAYAAATAARATTLGIGCTFACETSAAGVVARLQAADLCVSLSRSESFGMAVAEALACGTPVLAVATGEFARWIRHEHDGWLYDAGDHAGLAACLHRLLTEPQRLATAAMRVRRPPLPDWDTVADRFVTAVRQEHLADPFLPT